MALSQVSIAGGHLRSTPIRNREEYPLSKLAKKCVHLTRGQERNSLEDYVPPPPSGFSQLTRKSYVSPSESSFGPPIL